MAFPSSYGGNFTVATVESWNQNSTTAWIIRWPLLCMHYCTVGLLRGLLQYLIKKHEVHKAEYRSINLTSLKSTRPVFLTLTFGWMISQKKTKKQKNRTQKPPDTVLVTQPKITNN